MKARLPMLSASLLIISGCAIPAAKHTDLSYAHITSIRVHTSARSAAQGGPISDVTYSSHLPCAATSVQLEVELRAKLPGSEVEQVFTTSPASFARRVRDQPAQYVGLGIDDGYAYGVAHWLDEGAFRLQASGGLRAAPTGLSAQVDPLAGVFIGHALTVRLAAHPEPAVEVGWKQDLSCQRSAGFIGDPSGQGRDGPALVARVTKVRTVSSGPVLFGVLERGGASSFFVGPLDTPFTIYSHGQDGAAGQPAGDGGSVTIVLDERFPELAGYLVPQSKGGAAAPGATKGANGVGSIEAGDVLLALIGRADLPVGMAFLDSPIRLSKPRPPQRVVPPPARPPPARPPSAPAIAPKPPLPTSRKPAKPPRPPAPNKRPAPPAADNDLLLMRR